VEGGDDHVLGGGVPAALEEEEAGRHMLASSAEPVPCRSEDADTRMPPLSPRLYRSRLMLPAGARCPPEAAPSRRGG
jgi:hypothetical protein